MRIQRHLPTLGEEEMIKWRKRTRTVLLGLRIEDCPLRFREYRLRTVEFQARIEDRSFSIED
jgi:hypothetical protein